MSDKRNIDIGHWAGTLTYEEIHSAALGLIGVPLGMAWAAGMMEAVGALLLLLIGYIFGVRKLPVKADAAEAIRNEPWYFVFTLVIALVIGTVI